MAKKISGIAAIVMVLLLSLAYVCGAGNKRPSDDWEPFDAEHNSHWQDIEKNSVVTTDFEGNIQLMVTAGKRHQIIFLKNTGTKAIDGNFYVTDAKSDSKPLKIAGDFKHNDNKLLFTAQNDKFGLILEAIFIPHETFMQVTCKVEDTTGSDRAISVNYALNIDATNWNWWDDIRSSRKIKEDGKEYSNVTQVSAGLAGEMSFYPFSCISSDHLAISYGIPMNQPRIFKIYYDPVSKEYKVSFDFALTQKTEKFPSRATFSFIIYSPDCQWGFRAAAQDYYNIYPAFFEKRIEPATAGIWMPFTRINSVENAQDFHFAFHEYGDVDLKYNKSHNIYSFRYLEPWTYWMPMDANVPRQYEKAMALLKEGSISGDTEKQKISQATMLSGIYDEKGNLAHDFLSTPWCSGVVFHNNTDPDITHSDTLSYNRADICFEIAKDEVVERKIVCFDAWEHYGKGYEIDTGSLSEEKTCLRINRTETAKEYGARQLVVLNQEKPIPLIFGGYSKAEGVIGVKDGDYSIYTDLTYNDNTYSWGHVVDFDTGTHDWQYGQKFIYPDKPVKSAYVHILFRGRHTGTVWFDDIFLKELTKEEVEKTGKQVWDKYVAGFKVDDKVKHSGGKSISVTRVGGANPAGGARQEIELNQVTLQPVKISGWSKAEGVTGQFDSDYSIYADVIYADNSPLYGVTANFNVGTSPDWQYKEVVLTPQKAIKKITLHLLFRGGHAGKVWFDDISLTEMNTGKSFITDGGFEKVFSEEESREFGKNTLNLLQNAKFAESDENLIVDGIYLDSLEGWAKGKNFRQEHFKYTDIPLGFDTFTKKSLILNAFSVYEFTKAMSEYMHENKRLLMANWVPIDFPFYCHLLDVIGKEVHWLDLKNEYNPDKDSVMNYRRTLSYQKPYLLLLNVHFDRFGVKMMKNYFQNSLFYGMFPSMFSYDAATDPYFQNPQYYNRDRGLFIKYLPLIKKISKAGWEPVTLAISTNKNIFVERYGRDYFGTLYFTVHNNLDFNQKGFIKIDKEKLRLIDKFKITEIISNAESDYKEEEKEIILPVVLSGYQTKVYRLVREDYGALLAIAMEDLDDAAGILNKYFEQKKISSQEQAEYGDITAKLLKGVSNKNLMENVARIEKQMSVVLSWAKDKKHDEMLNQLLKIECDISSLIANASNVSFTLKTTDAICSPSDNNLEMEILNNSKEDIIVLDETVLEISPNLKIKKIKHQLEGKSIPQGKSEVITVSFSAPAGLEEGMEEAMNAKVTLHSGTNKISLSKAVLLSVVKNFELKLEPLTVHTFNNKPEFKIFLRNNSSAPITGTLSVTAPDNCVASLEKEDMEIAPYSMSSAVFEILCPLSDKRQDFDFELVFNVDGKEKISQKGAVSLFPKRENLLTEERVSVKADSNYAGYNTAPLYDGIIDTEGFVWNESAWASAEIATPHWIEISFPKPVEISSVMIHWALDDNKYWVSNKYKIEYFKNDEWVLLDKMEGSNTAEKFNKHIFNRVSAQKVRIEQEIGGGPKKRPDLMWIREVEVYP